MTTDRTLTAAERYAAEAILDRPGADPDDDPAIVARAVLRSSAPLDAGLHSPGDHHQYRLSCKVCGQYGVIRVSIDPQTS